MTAVVKQVNTYPYTDIHTPTQAHKHTRNAHNYRSPNINMISAFPTRETRVLYYSDKSPKNELRITFRRLTDKFILLSGQEYICQSTLRSI